jgi:hypothetical protein
MKTICQLTILPISRLASALVPLPGRNQNYKSRKASVTVLPYCGDIAWRRIYAPFRKGGNDVAVAPNNDPKRTAFFFQCSAEFLNAGPETLSK